MSKRATRSATVKMCATQRKRDGWTMEVPIYAQIGALVLHQAFTADDPTPRLRGDMFAVSALPAGRVMGLFRSWKSADLALRALAKVTDWSKVTAETARNHSASVLPILRRYRAERLGWRALEGK